MRRLLARVHFSQAIDPDHGIRLTMRFAVQRAALVLGLVSFPVAAWADGDPLLEPVAAADRQVRTWDEALTLWRQNSSDLRIAAADVLRAQARHRIALGALLPSIGGNALASFSLLPAPAGGDATTSALFAA